MKIRAFITHKKAETYKDCQDRFCINSETKSLAVSDGVSQSIFPGIWAEMLVYEYTNKNWYPNHENAKELAIDWHRQVNVILEAKKQKGENTRNLENALAMGKAAGATIVGVRFINKSQWTYDVLGDSCLIHLNKDNSIKEIYSSQDGAFDSHPDYLDSNEKVQGRGITKSDKSEFSVGEKLLLVSDPFSEYLYKKKDNKDDIKCIKELLDINNHESFCSLVDDFRSKGMHNDDSTLIIIEYDENEEFEICHYDDIENLKKQELQNEKESITNENNPKELKQKISSVNATNTIEIKKDITWKDVCFFLEAHLGEILSIFKSKNGKKKAKEIVNHVIEKFKP